MSEYLVVDCDFNDKQRVIEALEAIGYKGKVEVHEEAQNLIGYQGDKREGKKANIIVRRKDVGGSANDLGFEKVGDKYLMHVSDYDKKKILVTKKLRQVYAEKRILKSINSGGQYSVSSRMEQKDGSVKLRLARMY